MPLKIIWMQHRLTTLLILSGCSQNLLRCWVMSNNHPNRARGSIGGYSPTPEEVREYRGAMTQSEAGALIYTTDRIWRKYEAGDSRMHPASWRLLQLLRGL